METQKKKLKEEFSFKVCGANWDSEVLINPDDFEDPEVMIFEVATRGVENYLRGEFNHVDKSHDSSGCGVVILVEYTETGRQWALPCDKILFNASKDELGKQMEKKIGKRKKQ